MPQQSDASWLNEMTEVPAGWPLTTVIHAFAYKASSESSALVDRAREVVSHRLVELWASQPEEAEAWLSRCRERFAVELAAQATGPELLIEALLQHGAAECVKYGKGRWQFSEAGLLRGEPSGSAAEREAVAAWYLQESYIRDRCRELAERLVAAESQETARKRQKLEEETAERRRLEAELQKSQEEGRELRSRLAVAEAEVSSKTAELQTAQTRCQELCQELAHGAAGVEEMQKELRQLQNEHGKCQERCNELASRMEEAEAEASEHAKTKERLVQAESDAAQKQMELQRLQAESRGYMDRAPEEDAKSKVELQVEKAVLLERCEQLRQQLSKAEAERSAMLGQMHVLWEEKATYQERCRQLERQLAEAKPPHSGSPSVHASLTFQGPGRESDLTEYIVVDDDAASSSVLSRSSWFSVKPDCFMPDAIFKTRSSGVDFFLMGRDLRKGSQVVAADDETILEVCEAPVLSQATETVRLQAGAATLRVTPDHQVQVPEVDGAMEDGEGGGNGRYAPAGSLKPFALIMLDSGEPAALTGVASESGDLTGRWQHSRAHPASSARVPTASRQPAVQTWGGAAEVRVRRRRRMQTTEEPPSRTRLEHQLRYC